MKRLALALLVLLVLAMGVYADIAHYYQVDPVDANNVYVACSEGRPTTSMRLDGVLEVYCHTPAKH
jgi:hypothetical protein